LVETVAYKSLGKPLHSLASCTKINVIFRIGGNFFYIIKVFFNVIGFTALHAINDKVHVVIQNTFAALFFHKGVLNLG